MIGSPFKQRAPGRNKDDQKTFPKKKPISTQVDPKKQMRQRATELDSPSKKGSSVDNKLRGFASKSPSKKSQQLQQILKSIGNKPQASKRHLSKQKKEEVNKSNSMLRSLVHSSIQTTHNHTKSFQALHGGVKTTTILAQNAGD